MNILKITISFTLLSLFFAFNLIEAARAQIGHITSRNMAMGGGGTAYMDGYHANFINPANLALNFDPATNVEIGLAGGLSASAGGSLANTFVYNRYFTNDLVLAGETADNALNGLFGRTSNRNMKMLGFNADFIGVGLRIQNPKWSFSAAGRARALFRIGGNRGLGKLLLKGINADDFGETTPVDFTSEIFFLSELSVGIGRKFTNSDIPFLGDNITLYLGAAPKLVLGMNYTKVDLRSTLQVQENSPGEFRFIHDFEYNVELTGDQSDQFRAFAEANNPPEHTEDFGDFFNPRGNDFSGFDDIGFGLSLGGSIQFELNGFPEENHPKTEFIRLGISVTDIGSVTFDKSGIFTNANVFDWQGVSNLDFERIESEFDDDTGSFLNFVFSDSLGNGIYADFQPKGNEKVKAKLPTRLNVGGLLQIGNFGFSLDISSGLRDVGLDADKTTLSLGSEYLFFNVIPLRAGVQTGGINSTVYSVGTGVEFKHITFTVAISSTGKAPVNGSRFGAAVSGLVLRF